MNVAQFFAGGVGIGSIDDDDESASFEQKDSVQPDPQKKTDDALSDESDEDDDDDFDEEEEEDVENAVANKKSKSSRCRGSDYNSDHRTPSIIHVELTGPIAAVVNNSGNNNLMSRKKSVKQTIFEVYNHAFLFALVARDEFSETVRDIVELFPSLMNAKDHRSRGLLGMASFACRKHLMSLTLLYGRYQLMKNPPSAEHRSSTCEVYLAVDEMSDNKVTVALKFMKNKDQFERELVARSRCNLSEEYVLGVIRNHNETESKYRSNLALTSANEQLQLPFCLVMNAAERNLHSVLLHEHVAGKDWSQIRYIVTQLLYAVRHIHQQGLMHGDIKREFMI